MWTKGFVHGRQCIRANGPQEKAKRGTARESPSWHMQRPSALSRRCFPYFVGRWTPKVKPINGHFHLAWYD
jgi:hypothetical protein